MAAATSSCGPEWAGNSRCRGGVVVVAASDHRGSVGGSLVVLLVADDGEGG